MAERPRILIRATNWIGDCVMSLAALRELRRLCPDACLVLLARPWVAGLYQGQELVDEILAPEGGLEGIRNTVLAPLRWRGFQKAVLFQNAFRAALIAALARIPERIGYSTDGRRFLLTRHARPRIRALGRHQVFYYLDLLYQTGLSPVDYLNSPSFQPDLSLKGDPAAILKAQDLLQTGPTRGVSGPLVTLNPGASFGPAKRWFPDRFAALGDRLIAEMGARVALVGSSRERSLAQEIGVRMKQEPVILSGRTDLQTLMGVLTLSDLFITNDSGPMHLAAALGVTQIALFGSTDDTATGPFSPKARVLHKHVECSPCLLRECPIDLRCFQRISVQEVYSTAVELLNCA